MQTENYKDFMETMTVEEMESRRHKIASTSSITMLRSDIAIQDGRSTIPLRMNGDRLWYEDNQLKIALKKLGRTWYEDRSKL